MSQRRISKRSDSSWKRLGSWYGARLFEQYGQHPPEDWCELFDRTDDERLWDALLAVRRESPVHPPTLGQIEAALPKKQWASNGEPSKPQQCADLMLAKHGEDMCKHQRAMPWNYFGPMREFEVLPKSKPPMYITHPDPRGVQVPACEECGKPTYRMTLDEAVSPGVAA